MLHFLEAAAEIVMWVVELVAYFRERRRKRFGVS